MKNFKRKAFTLIELLVVIAIIGILFVVLISKVDFATEKAKATGVQTDFRSYQLAIETVARENAGLSTLVDDDASGEEKYAALEAALNKNLDPKLRVEFDADGKISTKAKDPWKEQYLGAYLAPDADGTVKDRGAIVMYCKGSNLKLGSTAEISNGVVNITIESGKEIEGSDDYSISTIYTYVNGYGEIKTATDGFSNDMGDDVNQGNNTQTTPMNPINPDIPSDPVDPNTSNGGLYDNNGNLVADWSTLVNTYKMNIEKDYDDSTYKTDSNSLYYVLSNNTELSSGKLLVINNSVAKIGQYAFQVSLDVEIPPSVSFIGNNAFSSGYYGRNVFITDLVAWCKIDFANRYANPLSTLGKLYLNDVLIADLKIPDEITEIKQYAFLGATNIKSVDLNNAVSIGECAFSRAGLGGELFMPETLLAIGNSAFYGCSGLTNVAIGNNVTFIGNSAFYDCSGLTNIAIPNGVTSIGNATFSNCSGLVNITIPNSVATIGEDAFSGCSILTSVSIPNSVTSIGREAFYNCTGLMSLDLGSKIANIGSLAFYNCSSLTGVYITDLAAWCKIDFADAFANPLYYAKNLYLNNAPIDNLVIPDEITEIKSYTFSNAQNITGTLTIHNNVTSIGECAFSGCGLTGKLVIPNSITTIGDSALCSRIETVVVETNTVLPFSNNMLVRSPSLKIYVPESLVNDYKNASGWIGFADIIYPYYSTTVTTCPAGGSHIYYGPGLYNTSGELVVSWDELVNTYGLDITKTYNSTSGNANNYATNASSLHAIITRNNFGDLSDGFILSIGNVDKIGAYALYKMDSSANSNYSGPVLKTIIIPSSVISIGQYAFGDFSIDRFLYNGTQDQWSSVSKGTGWYGASGSSFTLHCTDGDLSASGCVSADTLILLADGTTKRIDEITYDDIVMVWSFETGTYDAAPISIIFYHGHKEHDILNLKFSDGTVLKVINDHGLYSANENNYVYISINNVENYIGHQFVKYDGNVYTTVTLLEYYATVEYTGSYCLQTAGTNNYIADGMFSLTKPDVEGWFDYFVIGGNMKYDEAQMQADIAEYGLYTYEDFIHTGITYEQFLAFNGPYLKVLVGRGILTFERIEELIGQYL